MRWDGNGAPKYVVLVDNLPEVYATASPDSAVLNPAEVCTGSVKQMGARNESEILTIPSENWSHTLIGEASNYASVSGYLAGGPRLHFNPVGKLIRTERRYKHLVRREFLDPLL